MITFYNLNVQVTFNTGNYSSVRIGGDFTANPEKSTSENVAAAIDEIHKAFADYKKAQEQPQEQPQDERKLVKFGDPVLQKIVNKIQLEKTPLETVSKYYTFDEKAQRVIDFAYKLNNI